MKLKFGIDPNEIKKRRREVFTGLFLLILFLLLTWFEFRLFEISQRLPINHSIFFLGLINFNIIILLFLLFLIFRNIVKAFVEKESKVFGNSLKRKLMAAFGAFTFIPTVLLFVISIYYVNGSFDKWFSTKTSEVLKESLEVTNSYYVFAKRNNYHYANKIAEFIRNSNKDISHILIELQEAYGLHVIEYYPDLVSPRIMSVSRDEAIPEIPVVNQSFLEKGLINKVEMSEIEAFGKGNLIRVIVPVSHDREKGAVVVSTFIPLSLVSKIDDIASTYQNIRDVNPLEYPIKSIFLIILVLITLVILMGATWFGIHLAKQLSGPLELVAKATHEVGKGHYQELFIESGSSEINELISRFNHMIRDLVESERRIQIAHNNLQTTLERLDERSRYIEVVLSNVTTGVVALDSNDKITTINRYAGTLLKRDPHQYIGKRINDILKKEYFKIYKELIENMRSYKAECLSKEIRVEIEGRSVPLQVTLSFLYDEKRIEMGKVLVFDDLTHVVNAQRAAAWTEVARRIAHEIKNPLTPIKLSAQRLQKKFSDKMTDQIFAQCTSTIIEQADELKNLINEFRNFARLPEAHPEMSSLHSVIDSALVLYQTGHPHYQFIFSKDENMPIFMFDAGQIKRVFVNILDNALNALEGRENACVEIITTYDSLLKIARITIKDNGRGISKENLTRIFEPYFSTKEGGMGLGLSIVRRIIEDHNGFVRVFSHPDLETKVVIEIPVLTDRPVPSFLGSVNQGDKYI